MLTPITALYAGALTIIGLALAIRVSGVRMRLGIALGSARNPQLLEAVRRHANFAEWVPLALALMLVNELNGANEGLLHTAGYVLVLARLIHPFGVKHDEIPHAARAVGASLTWLVIVALAIAAVAQSLMGWWP